MHNHGVALTGELEEHRQLRPLGVLAGCLVGKDAVECEAVELTVWILVRAADPDIAQSLALHTGRPCWKVSG
jgi:hypothetical protein